MGLETRVKEGSDRIIQISPLTLPIINPKAGHPNFNVTTLLNQLKEAAGNKFSPSLRPWGCGIEGQYVEFLQLDETFKIAVTYRVGLFEEGMPVAQSHAPFHTITGITIEAEISPFKEVQRLQDGTVRRFLYQSVLKRISVENRFNVFEEQAFKIVGESLITGKKTKDISLDEKPNKPLLGYYTTTVPTYHLLIENPSCTTIDHAKMDFRRFLDFCAGASSKIHGAARLVYEGLKLDCLTQNDALVGESKPILEKAKDHYFQEADTMLRPLETPGAMLASYRKRT